MKQFTTSKGETLTIDGNKIKMTDRQGSLHIGTLDENGKVVSGSRLSLNYLVRAMEEYRNSAK